MVKPPPISKRLKELRVEADLSQKRLGILAGINEFSASARMNQYEKGKHIPDFPTIQRFAKVLKVPACYFYAEDDDMASMIKHFGGLSPGMRAKAAVKIKG
jgi:transcriptional regulator with XRE-family HTH domain